MTPDELFKEIDAFAIIHRDIHRVTGMELETARKMERSFSRVRRQLLEKLRQTPPGTFTEAKLRVTLKQLDAHLKRLETVLSMEAQFSGEMMMDQSVDDAINELQKFEDKFTGTVTPLPINEIKVSLDENVYLLNRFNSSILSYNEQLRSDITRKLSDAIVARKSYTEAVRELDYVMGSTWWRMARIARTEMHNIYSVGKLKSFTNIQKKFVPDLKKGLVHPKDARTGQDSLYLKLKNPIINIDAPFKYEWDGKEREFMAPPDRPNDRAILVPIREDWVKSD